MSIRLRLLQATALVALSTNLATQSAKADATAFTDPSGGYGGINLVTVSGDGNVLLVESPPTMGTNAGVSRLLTSGAWSTLSSTQRALALSYDGSVIVGSSPSGMTNVTATIWKKSGGAYSATTFTTCTTACSSSELRAVTADGAFAAGYETYASNSVQHAALLDTGNSSNQLLSLDAGITGTDPLASGARGIAAKQGVRYVVGFRNDGTRNIAALWQVDAQNVVTRSDLAGLNASLPSQANAIAANDPTVIVGQSNNHATLFKNGGAAQDLGALNGGAVSTATAISANGLVIAGNSEVLVNGVVRTHATQFYRNSASPTDLGTLTGGTTSYAQALWADGSTIVGFGDDSQGINHALAFVASKVVNLDSTIQSIAATIGRNASFVDQRSATLVTTASYDCDTFGANGACVSFGGRYSSLGGQFGEGAGLLTLALRVNDQVRVGAFIDVAASTKNPTGFDVTRETPTVGAFLGFSQAANGLGWQGKLTAAWHRDSVAITRDRFTDTEAGAGTAGVTSHIVSGEIGFGFALSQAWRVTPYAGLRHVGVTRAAYTEATTADVQLPVTYGAFGERVATAFAGVRLAGALTQALSARADVGLDVDVARRFDGFTASGVPGLSGAAIPLPTSSSRTHLHGSVGLSYALAPGQSLNADVILRNGPNTSKASVTTVASFAVAF